MKVSLPCHKQLGIFCNTVLLVVLAIPISAIADYTPPPDKSAPSGSTTTTGTRGGCSGESLTSLTVLAPTGHLGKTANTHPLFAWHSPESTHIPLTFQLYKLKPNGMQLIYSTLRSSKAGLMTLSLPKTEPGLQIGQRYFWQVVLLCDPNRPSTALVAGAELKAIAPPSSLSTQIRHTSTAEERATQYAQAGLWYDAFAEISLPQFQTQQARLIQTLLQLELDQSNAANPEQSQKLQAVLNSQP